MGVNVKVRDGFAAEGSRGGGSGAGTDKSLTFRRRTAGYSGERRRDHPAEHRHPHRCATAVPGFGV